MFNILAEGLEEIFRILIMGNPSFLLIFYLLAGLYRQKLHLGDTDYEYV